MLVQRDVQLPLHEANVNEIKLDRAAWIERGPNPHIYFDADRKAFVFAIAEEVLSISQEGEVRVHGEVCGNQDVRVFEAIKQFFKHALPTEGKTDG